MCTLDRTWLGGGGLNSRLLVPLYPSAPQLRQCSPGDLTPDLNGGFGSWESVKLQTWFLLLRPQEAV